MADAAHAPKNVRTRTATQAATTRVAPAKDSAREESSGDAALRKAVRQFLNSLYPGTPFVERRREPRYPFPHLIQLIPAGRDAKPLPNHDPVVVAGKHLSDRGLAFFHQSPLPYRRVIAVLDGREGRKFRVLLDLTWCRFTQLGWYEGGGRILQLVEGTEAKAANWVSEA